MMMMMMSGTARRIFSKCLFGKIGRRDIDCRCCREWMQLVSQEILNPSYGLFLYADDDCNNVQLNPDSGVNPVNFCDTTFEQLFYAAPFLSDTVIAT